MNARSIVHTVFSRATHGRLRIIDPDGSFCEFGTRRDPDDCDAVMHVHEIGFYKHLLLKGEIGLGDSFLAEEWSAPDLYQVLRWFVLNSTCFTRSNTRWAQPLLTFVQRMGERFSHGRNRNTPSGSRRNIEAHYDLGNSFYEKFLDDSMAYSSAFFLHKGMSLPDAQYEKMDRICRKLDLQPGDEVLEIGCGWGSQAIHMARHYRCHVTAITLSPSQLKYAVERVAEEGLSEMIDVKLVDYRHMEGKFDKIVSIEMLEAVGEKYLPRFFKDCDRLLNSGGLAGVQCILGADKRYRHYRKNSDWIRKHIFPGSHLPTIGSLAKAKAHHLDLDLYHYESFGTHYATTLLLWMDRFDQQWPQIEELGFDSVFQRKWRFYLCYCAAAFAERHINVAQFVWGRTNSRTYTHESNSRPTPAEQERGAFRST